MKCEPIKTGANLGLTCASSKARKVLLYLRTGGESGEILELLSTPKWVVSLRHLFPGPDREEQLLSRET